MIEVSGERIAVQGPMVLATATALKTDGEKAVVAGARVIDLGAVTDADSAAVAVLLAWVRVARDGHQGPLLIANAPASVRSLAALYGVAEMLPFA